MLVKRRECFVAWSFSLIHWELAPLSLWALWFLRAPVLRLDTHNSRALCQLPVHIDQDKLPVHFLNTSFYVNSCKNVPYWLTVISLQNDILTWGLFLNLHSGKRKGSTPTLEPLERFWNEMKIYSRIMLNKMCEMWHSFINKRTGTVLCHCCDILIYSTFAIGSCRFKFATLRLNLFWLVSVNV